MGINFSNPGVLLLLPLLFFSVYRWYRTSLVEQPRRIIIGVLRLILLTLLVLVLAGVEIRYNLAEQSVVFVVDASASCEKGKAEVEKFIREALQYKKDEDKAGMVVCAANARIEETLSAELDFEQIESVVDTSFTDLASGIKLANAMIPDPAKKRIIVISDGQQNKGDALKEAQDLRSKNVRIDVLPLELNQGKDLWVDSLKVPQKLYSGEKFNLKVKICSNTTTNAVLRIYQDKKLLVEEKVNIGKGDNTFLFTSVIKESGFHSLRAVIEAGKDSIADNNEAAAFTKVQGIPRILVIEGNQGEGKPVVHALNYAGLLTDRVSINNIPVSLNKLQSYQAIVLCNVPAESMSKDTMEGIETAVRELGTGLVMIGGENSFGPGGYYNTPVEKALPVYMDLRNKEEIPSLGLVLVIDKSGSMGGYCGGYSKIDLAKEAAIESTKILTPRDKIGVIAFASEAGWVCKLKNVDELESIHNDIATIRADGGTNIFPALLLAYNSLKDVKTKYKHIILLTDGQSATTGDYYYLSRKMQRDGITMSTLAVGKDADTDLMEHLAEWGQGRYYYSDNAYELPRIFTKETMKVLREYIIEEEFTPFIASYSPLVNEYTKLPLLQGYVACSPKKTAQVVLASHRGDPVLVQWQYGLGRSVVLTTDTGGRWAGDWINWSGYNAFLGHVISWVLPRNDDENKLIINTSVHGDQAIIEADSTDLTESLPTQAVVVAPDRQRRIVELKPYAPGRYKGCFTYALPGIYIINVSQENEAGQKINRVTGGLNISYSPEFRYPGTNTSILTQIAELGGGSIIRHPQEAFAPNLYPVKGSVILWPWLLMLAVLLLPLDIAARKLSLFSLGNEAKSAEEVNKQIDQEISTFSRLRKTKEKANPQSDNIDRIEREKSVPPVSWSYKDNVSYSSDHVRSTDKKDNTSTPEEMSDTDSISRLLTVKKQVRNKKTDRYNVDN